MKQIFLLLTASIFAVSCNELKENQYEITGTVDPSLNGKNVFLGTQGGFMGAMPMDTVKVENGKFTFKGESLEPTMNYIQVEGIDGSANIILEEGEIEIKIDKNAILESTPKGTYNNDKLSEYFEKTKGMRKEISDFQKRNESMIALSSTDTVTRNKLNKEFEPLRTKMEKTSVDFIDANPKAYVSVILLTQLGRAGMTPEEIRTKYDKLDKEVKATKEGKQLGEMLTNYEKQKKDQAIAPQGGAEVGQKAPEFSAPSPEGKQVSLKESLGKVTIIDFWASWCGPCRKENPNVVALYNEFHSQGLNIIGVSLDRPGQVDKWKKAIADDKLTWNHVSNLKFWEEPIAATYGVKSIPATFILDANGVIVAKDLRGDALKAKVKELLAAK
jgi:peroxiredoxin